MEDSKSSNEKYLEQIAIFDPFLNPSDFENIENDSSSKKPSANSNFEFFKDNTDDDSKKTTNKPSKESPISTKNLSDSEKLKSIHNNSNTFFNSGARYNESPSRLPLSSLALSQMNQLSSSDSKVTSNVQLTPESTKKIKEKSYKAQSPHHSFNVYRFNNSTNISNSSGSIKTDSYNSNISTQNKKYEVKKHKVSNSVGGTAQECEPLRRRSLHHIKSKYNSAYSYKSGRFSITLSSHSEVSQSENSSCEENEKKNENDNKNKKDDKETPKDTTKSRKVKRFNISYSKNSSNDSTGSVISDFDPENAHLKHASSDKTVVDHHMDNNNDYNKKNNLIDFNNDEDDFFYQIQQSSMPILGRHKKKGNKDSSKTNKTSTNNANETSPQINNNDNIIDLTINQTNADNNQTKKQNDCININALSPPKSTPFNPPIFDINVDPTSTTSSLLGKFCGRSEDETKETNMDDQDLINLF